jgi:hypothetical protein
MATCDIAPSPQARSWRAAAVIALIALLAAAAAWWEMHYRLGMNADGTAYLGTSQLVAEGQKALWPYGRENLAITKHFPPLFPIVLGTLSRVTHIPPLALAPSFFAACLGLSLFLVGWTVWRYTRALVAVVLALLALLLAGDFVAAHVNFMSEQLFIFLFSTGLLALDAGAQSRKASVGLVLAFLGGIILGLSYWCRYAGIAFMGAGVLTLLFYPRTPWWRRLTQGACAAVPMGISFICMAVRNGQSATRGVVFQADQLKYLRDLLWMPACWILPLRVPLWWRGALCLISAAGFCLLLHGLWQVVKTRMADGKPRPTSDGLEDSLWPTAPWLYVVGGAAYLGMLVFSMICVNPPATPLENRLLAPVMPALVVAGAWLFCAAVRKAASPHPALAGLALVLAALAVGDVVCVERIITGKDQRFLMYGGEPWINSPTAKAVRGLPEKALIYSNCCDALCYLTGRKSIWVPKCRNDAGAPSDNFLPAVDDMRRKLETQNGYIVLFNDAWYTRFGGAEARDLVVLLPLEAVALTSDGAIYHLAPRPETRSGR